MLKCFIGQKKNASNRVRTDDLAVNSRTLCQLSYGSTTNNEEYLFKSFFLFKYFNALLKGCTPTMNVLKEASLLLKECDDEEFNLYDDKIHFTSKSQSKHERKQKLDGIPTIGKKIGFGTFGNVYECQYENSSGDQKLCVKRVTLNDEFKQRELDFLIHFKNNPHENVIKLYDFFVDDHEVYFVMPKFVYNLREYLDYDFFNITYSCTLSFFQSIIKGLMHLDKFQIIHRDLKPENVLVKDDQLIICDFGSAKYEYDGPHTTYICTRWYRAPEIILSNNVYTSAVDLWSAGCIFAEIVTNRVSFKASDQVSTLSKMFRYLGLPTTDDFYYLNEELDSKIIDRLTKQKNTDKPTRSKQQNILNLCKPYELTEITYTYIYKCLEYNPHKRYSIFKYQCDNINIHEPIV